MKQKVTVISVAFVTAKFLFCMCNCMIDSVVDKSNFLHVLGILHVRGHVHIQSHMFSGLDCISTSLPNAIPSPTK